MSFIALLCSFLVSSNVSQRTQSKQNLTGFTEPCTIDPSSVGFCWKRSALWKCNQTVKSNRVSGEYLHTRKKAMKKIPVLWEILEAELSEILWWNSMISSWSTSVSSTSATISRPQFWEQWVVQELETYWKLTIQKVVLLDRSWCLPASPHTCSSHGCAGLNQVNHCLRWHNEKCHACPRRCICISTCVCIFKHNDIDITHKVTNLISSGFKKFPLRPSSLHNDLSKQKHWVASPLSIYKHLHKGTDPFPTCRVRHICQTETTSSLHWARDFLEGFSRRSRRQRANTVDGRNPDPGMYL